LSSVLVLGCHKDDLKISKSVFARMFIVVCNKAMSLITLSSASNTRDKLLQTFPDLQEGQIPNHLIPNMVIVMALLIL